MIQATAGAQNSSGAGDVAGTPTLRTWLGCGSDSPPRAEVCLPWFRSQEPDELELTGMFFHIWAEPLLAQSRAQPPWVSGDGDPAAVLPSTPCPGEHGETVIYTSRGVDKGRTPQLTREAGVGAALGTSVLMP